MFFCICQILVANFKEKQRFYFSSISMGNILYFYRKKSKRLRRHLTDFIKKLFNAQLFSF